MHDNWITLHNYIKKQVGTLNSILFWKELWIWDTPLSMQYNRLFLLDQDNNYHIIDRRQDDWWKWDWWCCKRGGTEEEQIKNFQQPSENVCFSVILDTSLWELENPGLFTVRSTREKNDGTLLEGQYTTRCCDFVPRKINIFLWRLLLCRTRLGL